MRDKFGCRSKNAIRERQSYLLRTDERQKRSRPSTMFKSSVNWSGRRGTRRDWLASARHS